MRIIRGLIACSVGLMLAVAFNFTAAGSGAPEFAGTVNQDSVPSADPSAPFNDHSGADDPIKLGTPTGLDAKVLVEFFNATGGQTWLESSNWLSSEPLDSWHGVTADSIGRVERIELAGNGLRGAIPASLGTLSGLRRLDLSDNQLGGQIPSELGENAELAWLSLAGNRLTGTIPTALANLRRLQRLDLGRNQLTGSITAGALGHPVLKVLIVNENRLSGPLPAELGALEFLEYLNLHGNQFSGPIPPEIKGLRQLSFLALGGNRFSGPIPVEIGRLTNLGFLGISELQDGGPIPVEIGNLTKLTRLYLNNNQHTGRIPAEIGGLDRLETLELRDNSLSGPIPSELARLSRLRRLRLDGNRLTGSIPAALADLGALRLVQINNNQLTGVIPPQLRAWDPLNHIFLGGNRLSGCVPRAWINAPANDVDRLGLSICQFGLPGLVATPGELDPPFDGHHYRYSLRVGPNVEEITLTPRTGSAQVSLVGATGRPIPDADRAAPGHQVPLPGQETYVAVRATSADGSEEAVYNLRIVRGFPAPVRVADNLYVQAPGNEDLKHNIPDLEVVIGGQVERADFLSHFRRTGEIERWGYPTSEVLVLEPDTLTQFYQRGVVDFHRVGGSWVTERRLAWDYVGGGAGGSVDLGVEEDVLNPNPGRVVGPWGHKVSNFAIDGTEIGFADYFERLGGVSAFGFPKTDARQDAGRAGSLHIPGATPGFIRQYFQAAVLEFHPYDQAAPVKLTLLGDTLRELLVEDWELEPGFGRADELVRGEEYAAGVVGITEDVGVPRHSVRSTTGLPPGLRLVPGLNSALVVGYSSAEIGLVDVGIQIDNLGAGWGGPFPVRIARVHANASADAVAIAALPECTGTRLVQCAQALASDGFIPPGGSVFARTRVELPVGANQIAIVAGEPGQSEAWGPDHLQVVAFTIPEQPPILVRADVTGGVDGYWSDGSATVAIRIQLINSGSQPAPNPLNVDIDCRIDGQRLPSCDGLFTFSLPDGFGPSEIRFDPRVKGGSELVVNVRGDEFAPRAFRVLVPARIIVPDRFIWDCYSDRPGFDQSGREAREGCGGWYSPTVRKWVKSSPIRIWATGRADYIEVLKKVAADLTPLTGLEFEFVDSKELAEIEVHTGVPRSTADALGWPRCVHFAGCASTHFEDDVAIGGVIGVWNQGSATRRLEAVKSVTLHELLHVVVPVVHRHTDDHLMGRHGRISRTDEDLIRLNYDPLVRPGMTMSELSGLIVFEDELLDAPEINPYGRIRNATAHLRQAESVEFAVSGQWTGSQCRAPDFGWADYWVGNPPGPIEKAAYFDDGEVSRWYIDGEYWRPDGKRWEMFNVVRSNAGAGWSHEFTDPIAFLERIVGFADDDDFAVRARGSGVTNLIAERVTLPDGQLIRGFQLAIDDATDEIKEYGWTIRPGEASCNVRISARASEYGVEREIPSAIASQS